MTFGPLMYKTPFSPIEHSFPSRETIFDCAYGRTGPIVPMTGFLIFLMQHIGAVSVSPYASTTFMPTAEKNLSR